MLGTQPDRGIARRGLTSAFASGRPFRLTSATATQGSSDADADGHSYVAKAVARAASGGATFATGEAGSCLL